MAGQQFQYAFDDIGNRTQTKAGGDSAGANLRVASYSANPLNQYTSRVVPGTNDVTGLAYATATVQVNGTGTARKGEYFAGAATVNNSTGSVYLAVTNQAVLTNTTNTVLGNLFFPKTPENFLLQLEGRFARSMTMRKFFILGFAPENKIGKAVELETYDLAGCSPETIREAGKAGKLTPGFDYQVLDVGRRIGALPKGITLTVDRSVNDSLDFDVVVNSLGWKIVSNQLGNALKEVAGNDIELLPVKIFGRDGKALRSDFCVINVLQTLEAISENKTVRSRDKSSVLKLALMESKVSPDVHVFRVKEWRWPILIDDVAKRALNKEPHDGLAFTPVERE